MLLAWIACKLIQEEAASGDETKPPPTSLFKAVTRIAMADFIMSLDNVVAIAGASQSDPVRIVIGLVLSITMLLLLSAVIMEIMNRYRWIAYVGAAILAWTAADMMVEDLELILKAGGNEGLVSAFPHWAAWMLRIGVVLICMSTSVWWPGARKRVASAPLEPAVQPLEGVLD